MKVDEYCQHIFEEADLMDILMTIENKSPGPFLVKNIDTQLINDLVGYEALTNHTTSNQTVEEFDKNNQTKWFMPTFYKKLAIDEYVLNLCDNQEELQRCGEELLLYQERDLFDLLRYMVYLVDTMTKNNIIWGVGRGSSVSSFVLYKLKVHRVNSMFYKLSIDEFLR